MSVDWPLLRPGSKGPSVKALQRLLLHRGAELGVDGTFGPQTEAGVKAFQKANKLQVDGIVGGATWQAIVVKVANGTRGESARAAQELLAGEVSGVAVDGTFGPATEKATRDFQKKVGLAVDGVVGPHTWQLLVLESGR